MVIQRYQTSSHTVSRLVDATVVATSAYVGLTTKRLYHRRRLLHAAAVQLPGSRRSSCNGDQDVAVGSGAESLTRSKSGLHYPR
jgi:hypothetical protein